MGRWEAVRVAKVVGGLQALPLLGMVLPIPEHWPRVADMDAEMATKVGEQLRKYLPEPPVVNLVVAQPEQPQAVEAVAQLAPNPSEAA